MEITYRYLGQYEELPLREMEKLLSELSDRPVSLEEVSMRGVIAQEGFYLLLAEVDRHLIGMASLVVGDCLTHRKGRIEDVIVGEMHRGNGVGKGLVSRLIEKARLLQVSRLDLTSRRSRLAANKLYPSLGFLQPESNYYRMELA